MPNHNHKLILTCLIALFLIPIVHAAWFDSSYAYKRDITVEPTSNISFAINGTYGFMGNIIWANPGQGSLSVYYNNATNYTVVVNDAFMADFETEGGGINNSRTTIDNPNAKGIWHMSGLLDSTGNKNNLTAFSDPALIGSKFKNGYDFDGNDAFNATDTAALDLNSSFTFITWINTTATAGQVILRRQLADGSKYVDIEINTGTAGSGSIKPIMKQDASTYCFYETANINYNNGTPNMLVVTYNQSDCSRSQIYLNNFNKSLTITDADNINYELPGKTTYLGSSAASSFFVGSLDEVRIYNKILTPSTIEELYNNSLNTNMLLGEQQTSNNNPSLDIVSITPSSASTNSALNASFNFSDADANSWTAEVEWFTNNASNTSFGGSWGSVNKNVLYNNASSGVTINNVTAGQNWTLEVTIWDGTVNVSKNSSVNVIGAANNAPVVDLVNISYSSRVAGNPLNVSFNFSDADANTWTAYVEWFVGNVSNSTFSGDWGPANKNVKYNNATKQIAANATKGNQSWIAELTIYDGTVNVSKNSSTLTLQYPADETIFSAGSTNFNTVPDITNVSNAIINLQDIGQVKWLTSINAEGINFTKRINISTNYIRVNTSGLSTINTSVNITLYKIGFTPSYIAVDEEYDGTFVQCTYCNILSITSDDNITFNTTHFSDYEGAGSTPNYLLLFNDSFDRANNASIGYSDRDWSQISQDNGALSITNGAVRFNSYSDGDWVSDGSKTWIPVAMPTGANINKTLVFRTQFMTNTLTTGAVHSSIIYLTNKSTTSSTSESDVIFGVTFWDGNAYPAADHYITLLVNNTNPFNGHSAGFCDYSANNVYTTNTWYNVTILENSTHIMTNVTNANTGAIIWTSRWCPTTNFYFRDKNVNLTLLSTNGYTSIGYNIADFFDNLTIEYMNGTYTEAPSTEPPSSDSKTPAEALMTGRDTNNTRFYPSDLNMNNFNTLWKKTCDGGSYITSDNGMIYFGGVNNFYAWQAETGESVWNFSARGGDYTNYASAIAGDIIFFGSTDNRFYAVNATTGVHIWNKTTGGDITTKTSPIIYNNIVYFGSADGVFYALNANNGTSVWNSTTYQRDSSPAIYQDILYTGYNTFYAVNATNGSLIWSKQIVGSGIGNTGPSIYNNKLCGISTSQIFSCLNLSNGDVLWNYTTLYSASTSSIMPAVGNDIIYFQTYQTSITGFNGFYALNATNGSLLWTVTTPTTFTQITPALANNVVVMGQLTASTKNKGLFIMNASTGESLWNKSIYPTTPLIVDNRLFVSDSATTMYAFAHNGNDAPVIDLVNITLSSAYANTPLNVSFNFSDADADQGTAYIKWFTNNNTNESYGGLSDAGTNFTLINQNTRYHNSSNGVPVNQVAGGQNWTVEVTIWDGYANTSKNSSVLYITPNFIPVLDIVEVKYDFSYGPLNCSFNFSDYDNGDVWNVTLKWFTNNRTNSSFGGTTIAGTNFTILTNYTKYNNNSNGVPALEIRNNQDWICEATILDGINLPVKKNSSVFNIPDFIFNYNITVPNLTSLPSSTYFYLSVNVTSGYGPIDWVNFSAVNGQGVEILNNELATNLSSDIFNSTTRLYSGIGGKLQFNVTAQNNYYSKVLWWNVTSSSSISLVDWDVYPNQDYGRNVTVQVNLSRGDSIDAFNFSIKYANGTVIYSNSPATLHQSGLDYEIWNSTWFSLDDNQSFYVNISVKNDDFNGYFDKSNGLSFQVNDTWSWTPQMFMFSFPTASYALVMNLTLLTGTSSNFTYNFSLENLYFQNFSYSIIANKTNITNSSMYFTRMNLTRNNSIAGISNGTYFFNLSIQRHIGGSPTYCPTCKDRIEKRLFNISVYPPAGLLRLSNTSNNTCDIYEGNCDVYAALADDEPPQTYQYIVINDGGYDLTGCYGQMDGVLALLSGWSFSPSTFNVAPGGQQTITLTIHPSSPLGVYSGQLNVQCLADYQNSTTSLTNNQRPFVTLFTYMSTPGSVPPPAPTGGGAPGEVFPTGANVTELKCGDGKCSIEIAEDMITCPADCKPAINFDTLTLNCALNVLNKVGFNFESGPCLLGEAYILRFIIIFIIFSLLALFLLAMYDKDKKKKKKTKLRPAMPILVDRRAADARVFKANARIRRLRRQLHQNRTGGKPSRK